MLLAAGTSALALLLVAVLLPRRLAAARWPLAAPGLALLLWQALGLAAGLLALEVAFTVALQPYGGSHAAAVAGLLDGPPDVPVWSLLAGAAGLLLLARLLAVLVASTARTLSDRRRTRRLVDLVATRNPLLAGTSVVDHELPVAYCLPGLRPRVVLTRGVLGLLREGELRAVLAHEEAHLVQRHDLVVLPFAALGATFPRLPAVRTARSEVALLVELLADDRAARDHDRTALARALYKVGSARTPAGGLGSGGEVLVRAQRLLDPPPPLPPLRRAALVAAAAGVLALPAAGLVLPLL